MATFEERPKIELEIVLRLTEVEARFLYGLAGFSHPDLMEHLRKFVGQHYTEDYKRGFFTFMKTCLELGESIRRTDESRKVFNGELKAVQAVVSQLEQSLKTLELRRKEKVLMMLRWKYAAQNRDFDPSKIPPSEWTKRELFGLGETWNPDDY